MEPDNCDLLEFAHPPADAASVFAVLSPSLATWFTERFGEPTPIQRLAWPALAAGKNLLLSAPTGTGKTLAAFLPILDSLIGDSRAGGSSVRCLYVAPLKALGNDACRNLERHVEEIKPH